MAEELLQAHSIAEANLYLMLRACPRCGAGPLEEPSVTIEEEHVRTKLRIRCACPSCSNALTVRFEVDPDHAHPHDPPIVNPGAMPSRLIDIVEWLILFHRLLDQANTSADQQDARRLGYEAALCLDEALKFFEPSNDLPPESAFFDDKRRENARRNPTLFTRQRLLALRAKLPDLTAMQRRLRGNERRSWWQVWKRRDHE